MKLIGTNTKTILKAKRSAIDSNSVSKMFTEREKRSLVNINRKQIGELLKLSENYVVIDQAVYDIDYPNDLRLSKLLVKNDIDFKSHIADYHVYPDYAIGKIVNQGIRLLVCLLYPSLKDVPVGMIEHIKLREPLYPNDEMKILIKKWQGRSKIAKFEIAIENQIGILTYESTIYGTIREKKDGGPITV